MGQKVNPKGIRLLINKNWDSKWFNNGKNFADALVQDAQIRRAITKKLGANAAIDRMVIERKHNTVTITISTGRPGVIIGRAGQGINDLRAFVRKNIFKNDPSIELKLLVSQVKIPELSAAFVAQNIGQQLTRRINFRRAVKQAIEKTMQRGAKGIKVSVAGRVGGAEIARTEKFMEGKIPLAQFKANIDYALYHCPTTYGVIGVKVWIYKGDYEEGAE
jgi:small subunit ribosomal protein S3